MTSIDVALAKYVDNATQFEHRLGAVLGETKPAILRVEATKRSFKVMLCHPWRSGLYARIDKDSGAISEFMHRSSGCDHGNIITCTYVFPVLPEANTSEAALWEEWYKAFDKIPFGIAGELTKLLVKNDIMVLIEAIEIARPKRDYFRGNEAPLRYVQGILQQRHLRQLAPELAAKMKEFHTLRIYWSNQRGGWGYLNRAVVMRWLGSCTPDEIRTIMRATNSWSDLRSEMERIATSRTQPSGSQSRPCSPATSSV